LRIVRVRASDVDAGGDAVADGEGAGLDDAVVAEDGGLDLLRVLDGEDAMHRLQHAAVADLAAGLGVERRVVEDDDAEVAFVQFIDGGTVLVQRQHVALGFERVVAVEGSGRAVVVERAAILNLPAARACSFWRAMAASKAALSTVTLCSRQMSASGRAGSRRCRAA
jgi:hypothetical protein